jgi:hypothetical protein
MIATCVECGDIFPAKRVDAACCSPRCRKTKSRRSERKRPLRNARETPSTIDRAGAPAGTSAGLNVTDNLSNLLTLILRPHVEERGNNRFHLDRFDAHLDGELILTSRQPWYAGARELLRRGYPSDTLLTIRHSGKDHDSFVPCSIGYLAQWSMSDSTGGRLKRIRWQPMPEQMKRRGGYNLTLLESESTRRP